MRYALLVILLLAGCHSTDKIQTTKERYAGKVVFVYIFDEKTQLWNRATEETLLKADCGNIRFLSEEE